MRGLTKDVHGQTTYPYLKGKLKIVHLRDGSAFVAQLNYYEWLPHSDQVSAFPTFVAKMLVR